MPSATLLLAAAAAHYVERQPQSPNHFDTVGQVNFQGGHACLTRPTIASASTEEELRNAITGSDSIKAVGAGMSWSQNHMACADYGGTNIVTAGLCSDIDLTAAKPFYLSASSGSRSHPTDDIVIDEDALTVVVKSCVTVQALLEYLANYRTPTFVSGYTLESPATFYVGMTVGGAISGGTHGVSLSHGGWAGKVIEARAMLASGETVKVSKTWRPRLFRALKAGASRLGILLSVKLAIIVQGDVEEETHQMDVDEYRKDVRLTRSIIDRAMGIRANGGTEEQWRHVLSESELHHRQAILHVRQGEGRDPKFVTRKWSFFPRGREAKFRPDAHHQSQDMNMLKWLAYLDGTNWGSDGWSVEEGSYAPAQSWSMALATETEMHGDHLWKNFLNNPGDPDDLWCARQASTGTACHVPTMGTSLSRPPHPPPPHGQVHSPPHPSSPQVHGPDGVPCRPLHLEPRAPPAPPARRAVPRPHFDVPRAVHYLDHPGQGPPGGRTRLLQLDRVRGAVQAGRRVHRALLTRDA
jgi:hypothetical protein